MSYLVNPNQLSLVPRDLHALEPQARMFVKLCLLPTGFLPIHKLRDICSVNGKYAHDRIISRLNILEERGWLTYSCTQNGARMYYYIELEPLPSVLPNLPDAAKNTDTDRNQFLTFFGSQQAKKMGGKPEYGPKAYKIADTILARTSLRTAQTAAKEFWSLPPDQRKYSNLAEFSFRLEEMINRVLVVTAEDQQVERQTAKKKKLASRSEREWMQQELERWEKLGNEKMADVYRKQLKETVDE